MHLLHHLLSQVCRNYTRAYIHCLVTKDAMGSQLLSYHNLYYMMKVRGTILPTYFLFFVSFIELTVEVLKIHSLAEISILQQFRGNFQSKFSILYYQGLSVFYLPNYALQVCKFQCPSYYLFLHISIQIIFVILQLENVNSFQRLHQ